MTKLIVFAILALIVILPVYSCVADVVKTAAHARILLEGAK